jgi:signal transduction histidine kinase/DNA-binding NarL/FixJ family response regulator
MVSLKSENSPQDSAQSAVVRSQRPGRRIPLRSLLTVPFLLQITAAVGLTGWLSLRNGEQAVNDVASQLRNESVVRIQEYLDTYLSTPDTINQVNADGFELGLLTLEERLALEQFFWQQLQAFESVGFIQIGTTDGGLIGAGRTPDGESFIMTTNSLSSGEQQIFDATETGQRGDLLRETGLYDATQRPWFQTAIAAGEPIWSEIFTFRSTQALGLSATRPVYNPDGDLIGVMGTDVALADVSEFLKGIDVGAAGETFVMERSGLLVANSSGDQPFVLDEDGNSTRLTAAESDSPVIQATAEFLEAAVGDLAQVSETQLFSFNWNGERQFLQLTPIESGQGLDWLIAVVVPESAFMGQIHANTRRTIMLCLAALGIAALLGVLTSRQISRPIRELSQASKALADGKLDQRVPVQSQVAELEVLAQSYNQMAEQLQESFHKLANTNADLERRVQERTLSLEVANRAKSEFLANMSHELRTPLNGIMGYAQVLQQHRDLTPEVRSRVDVIYQCGAHLLTLINDVLDLSKIEADRMELYPHDFHLPALLQGVVEMCRIRAELKGINFVYESNDALPVGIHADEKRLRQVLVNLLSNGVKFTQEGSVSLSVNVIESAVQSSAAPNAAPLAGTAPSDRQTVRFTVRDTGPGIPADQQQRIFMPFEQAGDGRQQSEGTGLGLAISQKIVEMMDSHIHLTSEVGVGSVFWFDLELSPATEWAKASQADHRGQIIGIRGQSPRVLVADDKWENRSVVQNLLAPLGFEVLEADNGLRALQLLETEAIDLLITDLVMPEMTGFELMQQVRRNPDLAQMPILASSASVFEADRYKSFEAGSDDFLPKPIDAVELLKKLEQMLKLGWIYQGETVANLPQAEVETAAEEKGAIAPWIFPNDQVLAELRELAQRGNFKGLMTQANTIQSEDQQLAPFAQRLHHLAQTFQDEAILDLLKITA